jgi:uncharacterized protein (TIGR00297 family)
MVSLEEMLVVFALLLAFSIFSYKKKLLDADGILIANAIGIAAMLSGPNRLANFFVVAIFFLIAELASNFSLKKHETRGIRNVVGNALPALIMLFTIKIFPQNPLVFELAFFGAISAALADTLASEVGYYSKKNPIMITTFKKVKPGIDGGITVLGESAAFAGGLSIAIIQFFSLQKRINVFCDNTCRNVWDKY